MPVCWIDMESKSMREENYIVQFQRKDGQPDEEYIYPNRDDAEHHFRRFYGDDSGLYRKIALLLWIGDVTTELSSIDFA